MADKNFFKKLEREVSHGYKKSGLRELYEKNKRSIMTAAAIAAAAYTGGTAAPMLGGTAMGGAVLGGGLGYSLAKNKIDKSKQERAMKAAQLNKDNANKDLNNYLDDITGEGPQTGQPAQPGTVIGQPVFNPNESISISPTGGIGGVGGEAGRDEARLLAEAEFQKKMQLGEADTTQAERERMLTDYSNLISTQQNRILDENAPALYEDLNRRGLLRSSELGNAMGRERAKAAAILQENVGFQGLKDRESRLSDITGINNQYAQGRYGAIQRGMSLEDFVRQTKAAQLTGQALAPLPQAAPSSKGGQAAMIGAGANVVTAMKGK